MIHNCESLIILIRNYYLIRRDNIKNCKLIIKKEKKNYGFLRQGKKSYIQIGYYF